MKSVSVMWSQGVDTAEAELALSAIREFLRRLRAIGTAAGVAVRPTTIRAFGTWYIPTAKSGSPYSGTTWYVDTSYDATRRQVIGERFLELVRDEPWQKRDPHWDIALIDRDLIERVPTPSERRGEFALGAATPGLGAVVSVFRLRGIIRAEQRQAALRRLVLHHFGQVVGLPAASRTARVETIDGRRFCTNHCLLSRVTTVEDLVTTAALEGPGSLTLCEQCRHDVVEVSLLRGRCWN